MTRLTHAARRLHNRLVFLFALSLSLWPLGSSAEHLAYPALRDTIEHGFQQRLEQSIARLGLGDAVRRRHLSVALVDVTDPLHPRTAAVNGDEMLYAASLPKIAILLAAFERVSEGKLTLDAENRALLDAMIKRSSNHAATEMIHRVGGDYINQVLRSERYRLYDPAHNGGLWVGKEYGKGDAWRRDPLHNLSHGATALQVARFYYLLHTGRLVSPELSGEMKAVLADSAIHHKFVRGLEERYPDARLYRKSGSWRHWHADSALIEHGGRSYIAVALAESGEGGEWLKRLIVEMDALVMASAPRDLAANTTAAPQGSSADL